MRTYSPKPADIQREWHVIDATDVVLGRLAVQVATLLRGKHKPTYAPHVDGGDFVIVVNAGKVVALRRQGDQEARLPPLRLPGRPVLHPVRRAAREGPAPRDREGRVGHAPEEQAQPPDASKLKVYAGPEHPHAAQKAQPFEITQISQ